MKLRLTIITLLAFTTALLAFRLRETKRNAKPLARYRSATPVIRCSPDWNSLKEWLDEADIPPVPGAGSYQWKISTRNDSAQFYFNQGINMYYSFHIIEAMASFKKAARFDPQCAMLYWAQALAYGPNINDLGYAASPEALQASQKAMELAPSAAAEEKGLIAAMAVRYTADSADKNRKQLNEDYTAAMKALYRRFPAHADIAALYADAMMLEHPWDLWNNNGTPKPWEPAIQTVLEKLLQMKPGNPGANHYYIHVMEPSPYAAKALPCADRLGKLTPGLSHTVHMPSHIYLRTGQYAKGIAVNKDAVQQFERTLQIYQPAEGAAFLYLLHNLHMQANNAMLAGNYKEALDAANTVTANIPAEYMAIPNGIGNLSQYIAMTPTLVNIRFGQWDKLINATAPAKDLAYANILYHLGKGIACSRKQQRKEAGDELDLLKQYLQDTVLSSPFPPFSTALEGARVAEQLLLGVIHQDKGLKAGAITHFQMADSIESAMVYNEPRDWLLNPKHFLGMALLQNNEAKKGEEVLKKDLQNNSENGWALYGIWQALVKQNKTAEAARVWQRYKKAFGNADTQLTGPAF